MDVRHEVMVDAPAATAWQVLGKGFGAICEWMPNMTSSEMQGELRAGGERVCRSAGWGPFPAGEVVEELLLFDEDAMEFAYVARSGLPWFIEHGENHWTIAPAGEDRCVVRMHGQLRTVWWLRWFAPLMVLGMRGAMAKMDEEMKHMIEKGTPHPRVLARATA